MEAVTFDKRYFESPGYLLLTVVLCAMLGMPGCKSTIMDKDKEFVKQNFYDLSFKIPRSWVPIRTKDMIKYSRRDTEMNQVRIQRFEKGEKHPGLNQSIDPSQNIFELADLSFEALKQDVSYVEVERKEQSRFIKLGKAFQMKVRTMSTEGVDRMHWFIGAVVDSNYYRITMQAEQYGHLSTVNEAYQKLKKHLRLKKDKEKKKGEESK